MVTVLVWELKPGINGSVTCTSYPSQVKLQSCKEQHGQVNKESLPDIQSRWLTSVVTPYADLEAPSK